MQINTQWASIRTEAQLSFRDKKAGNCILKMFKATYLWVIVQNIYQKQIRIKVTSQFNLTITTLIRNKIWKNSTTIGTKIISQKNSKIKTF